jgi:hypothetical protein
MLTIGKDKSFIHCDHFHEAQPLTSNRVITILANDTGVRWYLLGAMVEQNSAWIVPLRLLEGDEETRAREVGSIRDFVVGENDSLV